MERLTRHRQEPARTLRVVRGDARPDEVAALVVAVAAALGSASGAREAVTRDAGAKDAGTRGSGTKGSGARGAAGPGLARLPRPPGSRPRPVDGGAPVIRTVLQMQVRAGRTAAFEHAWRTAARIAAGYPGAGPQTLLRDPKAPLRYTITADWDSPGDLAAYQNSQDRRELSAVLDRLRESAAKALLDVVALVPAAPVEEGSAAG